MVNLEDTMEALRGAMVNAEAEYEKVKKGNKAAATRLRKHLMTIRNRALDARKMATGEAEYRAVHGT